MERKREGEVQERVEQKIIDNKYGDGVAWCRGAMLGKGSFGSVYLATLRRPRSKYSCLPSVMAVKSAEVSVSGSIQKEGEVLSNVKGCPNIIRCFGEETTTGENGVMVYNLLLEYGAGGTLADRIKKSGGKGLPEFEVRCYTKSILKGLNYIHQIGYVHCDLKPSNILLMPNVRGGSPEFRAKIGDFGLAKRAKQCKKRKLEPYWRGTPMYLSPEAVMDNVQERPCDLWALGCIVLEMLTGKPPWDPSEEETAYDILKKIGEVNGVPKIPSELSKEATDFLKGCFVRKAIYRLTAEMLLNHSFVEGLVDDDDGFEELEEVVDINRIESISLISETDDDWSFVSEEDSISYWSEEDVEQIENEIVSRFDEERKLQAEDNRGVVSSTIDATYNHAIQSSKRAPSPIPSNNAQQYSVNFTIPAGV